MTNFIVSLLMGMLPEVLYFTLSICFIKDIKKQRLKLFSLLVIGYIVLIMVCRFQLLFYLGYIVYVYIVLKKLYKSKIIDLFIVSVISAYLTLTSFISFKLIDTYMLAYLINRLMLFIPIFVLNYKLNDFYNVYYRLWDRHECNKVKSITVRNISLVFINSFIVLLNVLIILCMLDYNKIG